MGERGAATSRYINNNSYIDHHNAHVILKLNNYAIILRACAGFEPHPLSATAVYIKPSQRAATAVQNTGTAVTEQCPLPPFRVSWFNNHVPVTCNVLYVTILCVQSYSIIFYYATMCRTLLLCILSYSCVAYAAIANAVICYVYTELQFSYRQSGLL